MAYTPASTLQAVEALYIGYFGRAGEPGGVAYWVNQINAAPNFQTGFTQAAAAFSVQAEAKSQHPFLANPTLVSPADFVESLYSQLFGRASDAAGKAYWVAQLQAAGGNPFAYGTIVAQFISGAQNSADGQDLTVIQNKVSAAEYFTGKLAAAGNQGVDDKGQVTTAVDAAATDALSGVTKETSSVDASKAKTDAFVSGNGTPGTTLVLTSKVDVLNGTDKNDTFIAGKDGTNDTLAAGDSLNGGSGTDTLQIFGNANAAAFGSATVKAIENVTAQLAGGTLDVSKNADVLKAGVVGGSTGSNTVTLTKTQVGTVQGDVGTLATFTFTDAAGGADATKITLDGVTSAGVAVANIETLTIDTAGKNDIGNLTAAAASKLTITGAGSLKATLSNDAAYKTIDATAQTGGFDIVASGATNSAQVLSIKGGSGADQYTTLFANLTKTDVIDLGGGEDTLAFADATDLSTALKAEVLGGVANVESIRVTGAGAFKADGDALTQTIFKHDSTGAFTGTTFSNTDKLVLEDSAAAASTVGMKLGQTTFNLDLEGSKTAASDFSAGLAVTGASTLNIKSSGFADVATANNLVLTTDSNGIINISGAKDLTATVAVTGATGVTVNAGSFTGKLDISGSAQADSITGGSGADIIRAFGGGVDTLTGGAGKDKFVVFGADADVLVADAVVTDIITDFVSGTDTIGGGGAAGSATNYLEATAAVADFATFLAAADTALNGVVQYYVGQVGANSFVAYDNDGNGFTSIVQLTGVSLAQIAQADIVA